VSRPLHLLYFTNDTQCRTDRHQIILLSYNHYKTFLIGTTYYYFPSISEHLQVQPSLWNETVVRKLLVRQAIIHATVVSCSAVEREAILAWLECWVTALSGRVARSSRVLLLSAYDSDVLTRIIRRVQHATATHSPQRWNRRNILHSNKRCGRRVRPTRYAPAGL